MNNPIKTFNSWAKENKDIGMEKNHDQSVQYMLKQIPSSILVNKFSFLDIGCGNGWVVRKVNNLENCIKSTGIDGAENMIKKARGFSPDLEYLKLDIENLNFFEKFDVVFSMEVFYYLGDPSKTIRYIYNNMLKENGFFIMGIDHYLENTPSLSWDKEFNLSLNTLSIEHWINALKECGFKNIKHSIFGKKENWNGTLIIYAIKK